MVKSVAAIAFALVAPSLAFAQGVQIEHDAVGCLVAGKFPVLNACFTPADELARARVYFKAENSPHWYYVEMKPETPCFTGTLPRPKKEIGGLSYYVEATDKAFNAARTNETATRVVGSASECRKDVPVAPFVDKATVLVGAAPGAPIVPLGFAAGGGLGAAGTAAVVGAGAAAAGGAAAAASSNGSNVTTTTVPPGGGTSPTTTQPPPTTAPTTTVPPTTTAPSVNNPPTLDVEYSPASGRSPLDVKFNLCGSRDPENDPLRFTFDFENDGTVDFSGGGANCRTDHRYTGVGGDRFNARLCVGDRVAGHEDICRVVRVDITSQCAAGDSSGPDVEWIEPAASSGLVASFNQNLKVDASDPSGVAYVDFFVYTGGCAASTGAGVKASCAAPGGYELVGRDSSGPPFAVVWDGASSCQCYSLLATAVDTCGNSTDEYNYFCTFDSCSKAGNNAAELTWVSEFGVPGASAQIVLNGANAFFPASGRGTGRATVKSGEQRLEGQLVAAGQPGTWRIELSGENAVVRGSIKVLAGDAIAVDASSVTFRMQGRAGERVVITFRTN